MFRPGKVEISRRVDAEKDKLRRASCARKCGGNWRSRKTWIPAFAGKTEGGVDFLSTLSKPLGVERGTSNF